MPTRELSETVCTHPCAALISNLEDHLHLLYTRGSVEFFNVYPGMYVPHPLRFRSDHLSQSAVFAAQELLALNEDELEQHPVRWA